VTATTTHQAIYRRWRAQTFGQIVGQEPVVTTLRNAVRRGEVHHALLFVGPRGTGKTSMARIVAKALNCTDLREGEPCDRCEPCVAIREGRALDVAEMDAASNNRVDDMRELIPRIYTAPSDLSRKVFIVDEVQRIREGWDILLKTLEEPPPHVAFIFCTTDSSQIRAAVISRVQRFDFRRLTVGQIEGKLRAILEAENREAEPEAIGLVARLAAGGMRDAESMLDQLLSSGVERLEAPQVRDLLGLAEAEAVESFVDGLVEGDPVAGLRLLDELEERGRDLRVFLEQVVDSMRSALVSQGVPPRWPTEALVGAARLLAAIDPQRQAPGGLRLQLELAVLSTRPGVRAIETQSSRESPTVRLPTHTEHAPGTATAAPPATSTEAPVTTSPVAREAVVVSAPSAATAPPGSPEAPPGSPEAPPGSPEARPATGPVAREPVAASTLPATTTLPAATLPQPPPDGDLAELQRRWPEIVAHISQHPPTKPLIAACRPIAVDGNVVTLGFPEGQAFLRDVAERRRSNLEEGIGRFIGRTVAVRCVATNLDLSPAVPADDEAAYLLGEARRIFADDLVDVPEVT